MSARFDGDPDFNGPRPKPAPRRRFTLIELMVVIAIIGFLIALLPPASRGTRHASRRAQCTNNLKQILLALHNYASEHGGFPPAYTIDANGRPLHSWRTLILPYLEQKTLYDSIDLAKPWDDPANAKAAQAAVHVYACPSAGAASNTTTYLANAGPNGGLAPGKIRPLAEITDDPDWTLLVIDAAEEQAVPWMAPVDAGPPLVLGFGPDSDLHHPGGTNAGFVSGQVLFLKATTSAETRRALMSIDGGDDAVVRAELGFPPPTIPPPAPAAAPTPPTPPAAPAN